MMLRSGIPALTVAASLALAACSGDTEEAEPEVVATAEPATLDDQTEQAEPENEPEAGEDEAVIAADVARAAEIGSPMEDRVATLGLLNKRNNVSQDLELKPGESRRIGDVIVRLSACERTAPWEMPQETGAFVQVLVQSRDDEDQWAKTFSGWLFKESPGLNVVEHPVYDVWVKECAMSFPGEEEGSSSASDDSDA